VVECSRPLCAALIADAAVADPARLPAVLARSEALAPQLDPLGREYLEVAQHRVRLRLGVDLASVRDALAQASTRGSDRILPARLWGEALLRLGEPVAPALDALDADPRRGARISAALLRLRMVWEAPSAPPAAVDAALDAVLGVGGQMGIVADRLLRGGRSPADVRRLLDCFPY